LEIWDILTDRLIQVLQTKGFPVLPSPERAARAMAALDLVHPRLLQYRGLLKD
jgi:hypothetical protein